MNAKLSTGTPETRQPDRVGLSTRPAHDSDSADCPEDSLRLAGMAVSYRREEFASIEALDEYLRTGNVRYWEASHGA